MPSEGAPSSHDATTPASLRRSLPRRAFLTAGAGLLTLSIVALNELFSGRKGVDETDDTVDFSSLREGETLRGKKLRLRVQTKEGERAVTVQIVDRGEELAVRVGNQTFQPDMDIDGKNVTHGQWVKEVSKRGDAMYVNCSIFGCAQVDADEIARAAIALMETARREAGDLLNIPITYRYAPPMSNMGGSRTTQVYMRRLDAQDQAAARVAQAFQPEEGQ